jgi:hypothetical protein
MSRNRGRLSALASVAGGVSAVLVSYQLGDPRARFIGCLLGAVVTFAVAPVGVLVALGIVLLGGGRLHWLRLGVGPRVAGFGLGRAVVVLRLVPIAAGFEVRQLADAEARPGRRCRVLAQVAGPLAAAVVPVLVVPAQYRPVVGVCCGLALLSWLLSPRSANGHSALRELGGLVSPSAWSEN